MLILTRYNNQRIVVIAPDKSELWITADDGLLIIVGHPKETHCITPNNQSDIELSGQKIAVTYLETRGKSKPQHRIGIDAPKDYLILREELIDASKGIALFKDTLNKSAKISAELAPHIWRV